jgi:hypothetical protein
MGLSLACAVHAKAHNKASKGTENEDLTHEVVGAYVLAMLICIVTLPIEWAVDRRNPEMTKDLRFDLAGALIALAIIRVESTRQSKPNGGTTGLGGPIRGLYFESNIDDENAKNDTTHYQVAIDVFFFVGFLGAKLVGRTGTRELALLVMADIVDFIELTFAMASFDGDGVGTLVIAVSTCNAIVAFTFIFALVTLLLQRAEGPGQKALNALVQALLVHLPIIAIRMAIPISHNFETSFNLVFIFKNIVELIACIMDFLDAGSEVRNGGSAGSYDNLN